MEEKLKSICEKLGMSYEYDNNSKTFELYDMNACYLCNIDPENPEVHWNTKDEELDGRIYLDNNGYNIRSIKDCIEYVQDRSNLMKEFISSFID